jgi:FMN phosphatase YigB (HAD superfamily)
VLKNETALILGGVTSQEYFDGGIISAEVKYSKPDLMIYNIFLKEYNLKPAETLYIDDLEINVKAAESTGMKGYCTFGSLNIQHDLLNLIRHLRRRTQKSG